MNKTKTDQLTRYLDRMVTVELTRHDSVYGRLIEIGEFLVIETSGGKPTAIPRRRVQRVVCHDLQRSFDR